MLKYDNLVKIIERSEKFELLISDNLEKTTRTEYFAFPRYEFKDLELINEKEEFDPLISLFNSHDPSLISDYMYMLAKGFKQSDPNKVIRFKFDSFDVRKNIAIINGIKKASALSCLSVLGETPLSISLRALKEVIEKEPPFFILVDNFELFTIIKDSIKFQGLTYLYVEDAVDVVKALYKDRTIVSVAKDNYAPVIEYIVDAYDRAIDEKKKLDKEQITLSNYNDLAMRGIIISPEVLDQRTDDLLVLLRLSDDILQIEAKDQSDFDSDFVHQRIARESTVLLKNDGKLLPLKYTDSVGLFGEVLSKLDSNQGLDICRARKLKVESFVNGYSTEIEDNEVLKDATLELAKEVTNALLFVEADEEGRLSHDELNMINNVASVNERIVLVIFAQGALNIEQELPSSVKSVLVANKRCKDITNAIIDLVYNHETPSGALSYASKLGGIDLPIGAGLSYEPLGYSAYKLKQDYLEFDMVNKSVISINVLYQIQVNLLDREGNLKYSDSLGYKREFIRFKDHTRTRFTFDDYSFLHYDFDTKKFVARGGLYEVVISFNGTPVERRNLRLILPNDEFVNYEVKEDDSLSDALMDFSKQEHEAFLYKTRGVSLGQKVLIATLISLFYNAAFGLLIYQTFVKGRTIPFIISAAILLVLDVFYIVYLIVQGSKHKKEGKLNNDLEGKALALDDFNEVYKVTYEKEVEEELSDEELEAQREAEKKETLEEIETQAEEDSKEEEQPEEEVESFFELNPDEEVELDDSIESIEVEDYDDSFDFEFTEVEDEEILPDQGTVFFDEYIKDFVDFQLANGIVIEQKSARAFLSSLASSNLIFVDTVEKHLLDKFVENTFKFLDLTYSAFDVTGTEDFKHLIWMESGEKKISETPFTRALVKANSLLNHISLVYMKNVKVNELKNYFAPFLKFIKDPNNSLDIILNKKRNIKIHPRSNVVFIMTTDDTFIDNLPRDIAYISTSLELAIRQYDIVDDSFNRELKRLSYRQLRDVIRDNKGELYLRDDLFEKLDDIVTMVNDPDVLTLGCKLTLDIEKYAVLFLSFTDDQEELYDSIVATKIVPILKSYKVYLQGAGDTELTKRLVNVSGDIDLVETKRALRKRGE